VSHTDGTRIVLDDGSQMLDAMASWWSAIHGYNKPELTQAAINQLNSMPHVMFGGLSHQPATRLCEQLNELTPQSLDRVFLSDSGSVAVEVAMKMALQYWREIGQPTKTSFVALRGAYHGDTLGAMSVCDPTTGMHHLFANVLTKNHFVDRPNCRWGEPCTANDTKQLQQLLKQNHHEIAALILEPIVQGAGGMFFYSAEYLATARKLCDQYNVLLIADEIATGFGRSGKMFACEHANITPDILCLGKALTGGYMSLAATLTNQTIAKGICEGEAGAFMHGPTFMANPLACAVASASIELLLASNWQARIANIESVLCNALQPLRNHPKINDVRVLGAMGVIETHNPVDMKAVQQLLPSLGVWLRPFGNLIYTMPPYIVSDAELDTIASAMHTVVEQCS
jgi:adenosylmethionine-8-amino-7-oxononanoate aminotransferase